jgi:hypothetical protein
VDTDGENVANFGFCAVIMYNMNNLLEERYNEDLKLILLNEVLRRHYFLLICDGDRYTAAK